MGFKKVAKGYLPSAKVMEQMNKREGRKLTRNLFLDALRNIVYCGNVILRANGDEEERIIKGKNEALRDLYLEDILDEDDFREVKKKNKEELDRLIFKLNALKENKKNNNVEHKLGEALKAVTNISERYKKASSIDKRAIIGLIYPEKLTFNGEYFQTTKINTFAESIFLIKKELGNKKNRQKSEKTSNAGFVTSTGLYSNHLADDIDNFLNVFNNM